VIDGGVASDDEKLILPKDVKPGVKLMRDVVNSNGVLLVSGGHVLDEFYAKKLQTYENPDLSTLKIWVYVEPPPEEEDKTKQGANAAVLEEALVPLENVVPDPEGNKAFLT
jgi:hypothetical protein